MPTMEEWTSAIGVLQNANDRRKARVREEKVQEYMSALQNEQQVDTQSKDFDPLAHHTAQLKIAEAVKQREDVKQMRMKTQRDQIETGYAQLSDAARIAQGAAAAGDTERAKRTLMAAYNDLIPDGHKLGYKDGKVMLRDPQGNVTDRDFTLEEGFAMLKGLLNKDAYAQTWLSERAETKANNQEILANPRVLKNDKGEEVLVFEGLRDPNTGEPQPTMVKYKGQEMTIEEARKRGFISDAEREQNLGIREKKAKVKQEEFEAGAQAEDKRLAREKTKAYTDYLKAGTEYRQSGGSKSGKLYPVAGTQVDGPTYQKLKEDKSAYDEILFEETTLDNAYRWQQLTQDPTFRQMVQAAQDNPDNADKLAALLRRMNLPEYASNIPELTRIL